MPASRGILPAEKAAREELLAGLAPEHLELLHLWPPRHHEVTARRKQARREAIGALIDFLAADASLSAASRKVARAYGSFLRRPIYTVPNDRLSGLLSDLARSNGDAPLSGESIRRIASGRQ